MDKTNKFFFGTEISKIDEDEYIKRINDITEYYFNSCENYKRKFYFCCYIRIAVSWLIPIISLSGGFTFTNILSASLAGILAVIESYVNITRAYDKWTNYRATCNSLWIEQRKFATHTGEYEDGPDRFKNFVKKCEGLMIEETNGWKKYIERAKEMK